MENNWVGEEGCRMFGELIKDCTHEMRIKVVEKDQSEGNEQTILEE